MADPHQGETVFSTAIGQGIRTARQAATWTVGQRPCRVASPVGGIDSYAQQRLVVSVGTYLLLQRLTSGGRKTSRCVARQLVSSSCDARAWRLRLT
jgi:hypothetical protein